VRINLFHETARHLNIDITFDDCNNQEKWKIVDKTMLQCIEFVTMTTI
jgi:hypothetical protein